MACWEEGTKVSELWTFYFLPLFTFPLIMAVVVLPYDFSWRQIAPGTRFLLMAAGFGLAGYALEVFFMPHYAAPGTCLVFALVLGSMRNLRNWRWRQKPVGQAITRAIPLIAGALLVLCAAWCPLFRPRERWPSTWCSPGYSTLLLDRARIFAELQRGPQRHLVIVRYSSGHDSRIEWVYNRANIDASKVVWARDMGQKQNAELLSYFRDRQIWLVEADLAPPRLSVYPAE